MATQPGHKLGLALLSGENLWSFCLAGSDDNGAEHRPELCRKGRAADGCRCGEAPTPPTPPPSFAALACWQECQIQPPGTFLCFKP